MLDWGYSLTAESAGACPEVDKHLLDASELQRQILSIHVCQQLA
jgi:hypothetical protein